MPACSFSPIIFSFFVITNCLHFAFLAIFPMFYEHLRLGHCGLIQNSDLRVYYCTDKLIAVIV